MKEDLVDLTKDIADSEVSMTTRPMVIMVASVLALFIVVPASADSAKMLGKSGDWNSYIYTNRTGKICYTATRPKRSLDSPLHRAEAYISVTDRAADKSIGVVSIAEGYSFRKDAAAEIDVDGDKFSLYTVGSRAWTADDNPVVKAMLRGRTVLVYGVSADGKQGVDTYSLDGFAKAFSEVSSACGVN
jgi:hypothetical protein